MPKKANKAHIVTSHRDLTCPCGAHFFEPNSRNKTRYRLHRKICEKAKNSTIMHELVRHSKNGDVSEAYIDQTGAMNLLDVSKWRSQKTQRRVNQELSRKTAMHAAITRELPRSEVSEIKNIAQKVRGK